MREGLTVAEAQALILDETPILGAETLSASDAAGRVLAESVESARRHPPADCSAMDGYAVRREDLLGASADAPRSLPVAYEVPAGGQAERPLEAGEVARIFTGAPLPPGADAVVMQEDTDQGTPRDEIRAEPEPRANVRDAGEDFEELLELAQEDVREFLAEGPFAEAPIIPVSAHSGEGMDELRALLEGSMTPETED